MHAFVHMHTCACGGRRRVWCLVKLELQAGVPGPMELQPLQHSGSQEWGQNGCTGPMCVLGTRPLQEEEFLTADPSL